MHRKTITLYVNDPMGGRWRRNLEAASRAEAELGAAVVIVKKTSPEYRPGSDPPCPSVIVGGRLLVSDGTAAFEQLQDALRSEGK